MFLSRTNSAPLLRRWEAAIESGDYRRDQWALRHTVAAMRAAPRVVLLPVNARSRYFTFINGTGTRSLALLAHTERSPPGTL